MSVEQEHATEAAELHSLLRGILAKAPADRYHLEDLVRHEWVRGVGRNGVAFSPTQSEGRSLQPVPGPGPEPKRARVDARVDGGHMYMTNSDGGSARRVGDHGA